MPKPILIGAVLILLFQFFSCTKQHSLHGEIKGLGNDTLLVSYVDLSKPFKKQFKTNLDYRTDTIFVKNDKFVYDLKGNTPLLVEISPVKGSLKLDSTPFFHKAETIILQLSPQENVQLQGVAGKYFINYEVKGSSVNYQFRELHKKKIKYFVQKDSDYLLRDSLRFHNLDTLKIEELTQQIKHSYQQTSKIDKDYIENNYDKELAVYLSLNHGLLHKNFGKFDAKVRNGVFKELIDHEIYRVQYLNEKEKRKEKEIVPKGGVAPNFKLKDLQGKTFELHDSPYEYVVLDFWGSWCYPCIKGFPKMKEYYKKYKGRLEFVGIACNDNEEKWRKAVEEHNVHWTQLLNEEDHGTDVSLKYAVTIYPTKVIIDKQHKVLGIFEGETETFYQKIDSILN
ncbi:redoxin domain-containing protein [Sinomicrobium sp. M5D2P9]